MQTVITYKTAKKQIKAIQIDEATAKVWHKYKRTLAIQEPCKWDKILGFKIYCKKFKR